MAKNDWVKYLAYGGVAAGVGYLLAPKETQERIKESIGGGMPSIDFGGLMPGLQMPDITMPGNLLPEGFGVGEFKMPEVTLPEMDVAGRLEDELRKYQERLTPELTPETEAEARESKLPSASGGWNETLQTFLTEHPYISGAVAIPATAAASYTAVRMAPVSQFAGRQVVRGVSRATTDVYGGASRLLQRATTQSVKRTIPQAVGTATRGGALGAARVGATGALRATGLGALIATGAATLTDAIAAIGSELNIPGFAPPGEYVGSDILGFLSLWPGTRGGPDAVPGAPQLGGFVPSEAQWTAVEPTVQGEASYSPQFGEKGVPYKARRTTVADISGGGWEATDPTDVEKAVMQSETGFPEPVAGAGGTQVTLT